jgi:hypothetical protein
MNDCLKWLEVFIKLHGPIAPAAAYKAGKKIGFSRKVIRAARCEHGEFIVVGINGGKTTWQWLWL